MMSNGLAGSASTDVVAVIQTHDSALRLMTRTSIKISDCSRSDLRIFFTTTTSGSPYTPMTVTQIKTTAVIGAGIMGAGIAQVFAASGVEVHPFR